MRIVRHTARFKRDFKSIATSRKRAIVERELLDIVTELAQDNPLPKNKFDHALTGNWKDHRDCHILPDLVLIYRKPDEEHLDLVRLGSHAKLGL